MRTSLAQEIPLGSGVVIVRAVARLSADAAVTGATKERDTASHQAALERDRMKQLHELFDGTEAGALMIHLLQHPDDTGSVLSTLKDSREKDQALRLALLDRDRQHYLAMLDRALENNLINDSDAQPLRDLLFGQAAGATLAGSVTMVPIAPKPALSLPPGVAAGTTAVTPGFGAPGTPPSREGPAPTAGPPVAQGHVVDAVDTPVEDEDPNSPGSAPKASPGGVAGWKPIKNRGQGSA